LKRIFYSTDEAIRTQYETLLSNKNISGIMKLTVYQLIFKLHEHESYDLFNTKLRILFNLSPFEGSLLINTQILRLFFFYLFPSQYWIHINVFIMCPYTNDKNIINNVNDEHKGILTRYSNSFKTFTNTILGEITDATIQKRQPNLKQIKFILSN
jgi:hypothetical protein